MTLVGINAKCYKISTKLLRILQKIYKNGKNNVGRARDLGVHLIKDRLVNIRLLRMSHMENVMQ